MTTGGEIMNETIPLPDGAVIVDSQFGVDKVDYTVSQKWSVNNDAGLAIQGGLDNCIIKGNLTYGDSLDMEGQCIEGFAGALIVVYMDEEFDPDECEACNVDDLANMGGDYEFCAYRVELPCEPITVECGEPSASPSGSYYPSSAPTDAPSQSMAPSDGPSLTPSGSPTSDPTVPPTKAPTDKPTKSPTSTPTSSPTDPELAVETPPPTGSPTECPPSDPILIDIDGDSMYPAPPVTILSQNTTHVEFKVENTFSYEATSIFTQYHSGSFGETECLEDENVESGSSVDIEFTAECMHHTHISVINIWITDCSDYNDSLDALTESDDAEIPECCHPPEKTCKTVEYIFKLPCISPCPDDEVSTLPATEAPNASRRHLAASSTHKKKIHEHKAKLKAGLEKAGTTEEFQSLTGHAEPNDSEDHFCVAEDYPCGPDGDKVYACHYSARDGYKTFCVPEADSDALRFYPKDYCGPCVGGYVQ